MIYGSTLVRRPNEKLIGTASIFLPVPRKSTKIAKECDKRVIYESHLYTVGNEKLINHNETASIYRRLFFPSLFPSTPARVHSAAGHVSLSLSLSLSFSLTPPLTPRAVFFLRLRETATRATTATVINLRPRRCRCDISEMPATANWVTISRPGRQ